MTRRLHVKGLWIREHHSESVVVIMASVRDSEHELLKALDAVASILIALSMKPIVQ